MKVVGLISTIFAALAFQASAGVPGPAQKPGQNPGQQRPIRPRCTVQVRPKDVQQLDVACPNADHVRFIGLGDWGEEFEAPYVLAVRDGVLKEAAAKQYDFILTVGDNIYGSGVDNTTDPLWNSIWRQRWHIGTDLKLPWLNVLGNHDHEKNADAQIQFHDSKQPGAEYWFMPAYRYSINVGSQHGKFKIATVDTVTFNATDLTWLAKELDDPSAKFVLTAGHYHLYSMDNRGDSSSPTMLQMNQLIQSHPKAKGYLCGHEHSMQFFTDKSRDYFVFGGSGRTIDPPKSTPSTKSHVEFFSRNYGYALFDVDVKTKRMEVTYVVYDITGKEIARPVFHRQY